ncbi:MAG TPA: 50S ribosomal protein L17 [Myxococcales bacterium]|nr:50S ribosomal protein L17 [Myxococcales bacterium]
MRHMKRGRKLNRTNTHRKAMFRNMVTSLMRHERIVTTLAKAKELRGVADRVITYAKKGSLHHRRLAACLINDREVLSTVFDSYAERYAERAGGYTRIMKLGWRHGDAAPMAIIELMPESSAGSKKQRRRTKKADAPAAAAEVTTKESFEADESADAAAEVVEEAAADVVVEDAAAEVVEAEVTDEPAAEAAVEEDASEATTDVAAEGETKD